MISIDVCTNPKVHMNINYDLMKDTVNNEIFQEY